MKKLICIIMAAIFALSLTSCVPKDVSDESTESETVVPETTAEPAPSELVLADNGKTDFKVIRAEDAKGYCLDTAMAVNNKLRQTLSPDFKIADDWVNPKGSTVETDHEILLFDTNRAETAAAIADLDVEGYIIRVTEYKIVIFADSPAAGNKALDHFFDVIIPEHTKDGKTALPIGLEVKEEFKAADFDLGAALREGKNICADFTVLFNYPKQDGFTAAQGAASDGTYAYVIMKNGSGTREVDRVVKIDMATWTVVLESETLVLDHANDMTYDPVKKQLVVVNMYDNLVSIIDPETLTLVEQKKLPYGTWAVGYVDGTEQYSFLAYGSPSGLVIADSEFVPVRSSGLADTTGYIGQGMDADSRYAYVPLSPDDGTKDNIIQIFDIKTGEYLGKISVNTTMESESMFHVGTDFYLHFNNQGSKIASLELYEKFE